MKGMNAGSPARKAAFTILMAVESSQRHSDDLLRGKAVDALSPADRNLATALVLGVLRWQILLDQQIQAFLARPHAKLDTEVRIALRMGAFQLLHLDRIPARAAIDESVELAKRAGHCFASGMVNAVLRKLKQQPHEELPEATAAEIARKYAHPAWMVNRWAQFYGLDAAQRVCVHGQSQPVLAIRLTSREAEQELADAGIRLELGQLLSSARIVAAGDVPATLAWREGRVRLQDEGSQLVAEIAGRGDAILDCCAAPGGKTLILAERNPQARIVACESSPQRLTQLRQRLTTQDAQVECRQADAALLADDAVYDVVLADVPCSGTGTLWRNPEIRHRLRAEDLPRQTERQRAILAAALRAARPGGRVVYSTCSLEPEENEQVVAAVLAERTDVRLIPVQERIEELHGEGIVMRGGMERLRDCATAEGYLRLLPGAFHTDGFFIAMMERMA
jgi:16S rRNA (cytosine967-C5)-methyltransferase